MGQKSDSIANAYKEFCVLYNTGEFLQAALGTVLEMLTYVSLVLFILPFA